MTKQRTFRLTRDTFELRSGAVFKLDCVYGKEAYILTNNSFMKHADWNFQGAPWLSIMTSRKSVECEPKWFEEVFKVGDEYLNESEVKMWEDFKKLKRGHVCGEEM